VRTGAWVHVALTYDGTTYRSYVNGVADSTSTAALGSNESNGSWIFSIGQSFNTGYPGGR